MSGRKTTGPVWREIPVLIRSDIYLRAEERRIDISDECNRALAYLLNIDYRRPGVQKSVPDPAKTAVVGSFPERMKPEAPAQVLHPVINAEDPTVPAKVLRERKRAAESLRPPDDVLSAVPQIPQKTPPALTGSAPVSVPSRSPKTSKKTKQDPIKKFIGTKIVRVHEESPDAIVAKDELYQTFSRWCKENAVAPLPDHRTFAVALKNRYAIAERNVGARSCWIGIRVK
jgi:hypothetical protein